MLCLASWHEKHKIERLISQVEHDSFETEMAELAADSTVASNMRNCGVWVGVPIQADIQLLISLTRFLHRRLTSTLIEKVVSEKEVCVSLGLYITRAESYVDVFVVRAENWLYIG